MADEERVKVTHPDSKAVAHPLKQHLKAWLDKGWVQDEVPNKEGTKK